MVSSPKDQIQDLLVFGDIVHQPIRIIESPAAPQLAHAINTRYLNSRAPLAAPTCMEQHLSSLRG
jgi:hypothetical protein